MSQPPAERRQPGKRTLELRPLVLDRYLKLLPYGIQGELFLAAEEIARGYCSNPGETAARFVPDPFSSRPGVRMYRTGVIARRRPGGLLEICNVESAAGEVRGRSPVDTSEAGTESTKPASVMDEQFLAVKHRVAAIWSRLLDRDALSTSESFFDVGGHSLLALKMVQELGQEFAVEVPIDLVFGGGTIQQLARFCVETVATTGPSDEQPE